MPAHQHLGSLPSSIVVLTVYAQTTACPDHAEGEVTDSGTVCTGKSKTINISEPLLYSRCTTEQISEDVKAYFTRVQKLSAEWHDDEVAKEELASQGPAPHEESKTAWATYLGLVKQSVANKLGSTGETADVDTRVLSRGQYGKLLRLQPGYDEISTPDTAQTDASQPIRIHIEDLDDQGPGAEIEA